MLRLRLRKWAVILSLLGAVCGQDADDTAPVTDPFALWPTVDQTSLAKALNISIGCLDAMYIT